MKVATKQEKGINCIRSMFEDAKVRYNHASMDLSMKHQNMASHTKDLEIKHINIKLKNQTSTKMYSRH